MIRLISFCLIGLLSLQISQVQANQVQARLLLPTTAVVPGETLWFALSLQIKPGWHTYWKNPGSTGLPPTLQLGDINQNYTPKLFFPVAKTNSFGGDASLLTYGYTDAVVHPFQLQVPMAIEGQWVLEGEARWLVCEVICIPESQVVRLSLPVISQDKGSRHSQSAEVIDIARSRVPTEFPGRITFHGPDKLWVSGLNNEIVKDVMPESVGEVLGIVLDSKPLQDGLLIQLDRALTANEFSEGSWVLRTQTGGVRVMFDPSLTTPKASGIDASLGLILIMALAGGLILNLMPCVFPVLSIKALSIAKNASKDRAEVQKSAWIYTAGILVTMFCLASFMMILRAGGGQVGWGFQLQSPWFVAFLVYVFFLLALWLYGWVDFGARLSGVGQDLTEGSNGRAEFFTGVLAVVVATPCTAPFMGVAMGYTLTQPWWITLVVFFALGLGLAMPMLLFAIAPSLASHLPRPGIWMIRLKQFLAFPILATAIWLLWVLVRQTSSDALVLVLGGLLLLVFGFWLMKGGSQWSRWVGASVAILALVGVPLVSGVSPSGSTEVRAEINEETYSKSRLEAHLAEGRTVFVNMTADWCITCKLTEKRLLKTESVNHLFEELKVIRMTGDWTKYDPDITKYLNAFDRVGVPLYLVNHPGQDPIVLSQFPGFAELESAIKEKFSP